MPPAPTIPPPSAPPMDLEALLTSLDRGEVLRNLALTLALWAGVFLLRWLVLRTMRRKGVSLDIQRRLISLTRNVVLVIVVVGTGALWFDELKVFALSLVAVAAAIVLATKELIMCAGGTFLRSSTKSFDIGDRIEVQGIRGDVIDTTLFATTLLEIGPDKIGHQRTGRAIVVPNSIFLVHPVVNETITETYVLHTFKVVVANDARWKDAEAALLAAASEAMAPYADEAQRSFNRVSAERGIDTPPIEPRVLVEVASPQALHLHCRLPAPARTKGRIEQAIVRKVLDVITRHPPPPVPVEQVVAS